MSPSPFSVSYLVPNYFSRIVHSIAYSLKERWPKIAGVVESGGEWFEFSDGDLPKDAVLEAAISGYFYRDQEMMEHWDWGVHTEECFGGEGVVGVVVIDDCIFNSTLIESFDHDHSEPLEIERRLVGDVCEVLLELVNDPEECQFSKSVNELTASIFLKKISSLVLSNQQPTWYRSPSPQADQ